MTTTRHIIDITEDLPTGYEAEEASEAKSIAYEILEWTYVPDSGDAITAADRVVEALIKAGWRPTVEAPAAEHHGEPNADDPTDAEVRAAARALDPEAWETDLSEERGADLHMIRGRRGLARVLARAALVAARKAARHE
jgi:hypothetical protein